MAIFSGRTAEVTLGATDFNAHSWRLNHEIARVETTNTGSAGLYTSVPGIEKASGSFTIHYDSLLPPDGAPICIPGTDMASLRMYVDAGDDYFQVDTATVVSLDATADVNGNVDHTINWESNGAITGWVT